MSGIEGVLVEDSKAVSELQDVVGELLDRLGKYKPKVISAAPMQDGIEVLTRLYFPVKAEDKEEYLATC